MSRASGSPRLATVCSQAYYTPDDIGWNVFAHGVGGSVISNTLLLEGYGIWSIYILVTSGAGNYSLFVRIRDENDAADLTDLPVTAALVSGGYKHFAVSQVTTTVAFVARTIRLRLDPPAGAGNVTARMFGRAY